jgi:hypothetical protein
MAAIRADTMGESQLTAIGTLYQVARFKGIVGSAAIPFTLGMFSFWLWGHVLSLQMPDLLKIRPAGRQAGWIIRFRLKNVKPAFHLPADAGKPR